MKQHQANKDDPDLERVEKEAVRAFKAAACVAKDEIYEEFCEEVTEDRALFKFWSLYRLMCRKNKPSSICDFQSEDGSWMKTDQEKGEALFNRYLQQTDQKNEVERRNLLNTIRQHFADEVPIYSLQESTVQKKYFECFQHGSRSRRRTVLTHEVPW